MTDRAGDGPGDEPRETPLEEPSGKQDEEPGEPSNADEQEPSPDAAPEPPQPRKPSARRKVPPQPAPLGRRLRALRREQKLSLSEVARRSGVSKGYLSQLERSAAIRPSADTLFAVSRTLGASAIELYEGPDFTPMAGQSSEIPDSLQQFSDEANLPPADISMLAQIHYRGAQPQDKEDWRFLYESIRRSVGLNR